MLDLDIQEASNDVIWRAFRPCTAWVEDNKTVIIQIPFQALEKKGDLVELNHDMAPKIYNLYVRAYGDAMRKQPQDI